MSALGRFVWGLVVFAAGGAAILYGFDRLPRTVETSGPVEETSAPPTPDLKPEPALAQDAPAGPLGNQANASLRTNAAGLDIIKRSEGRRLEAYQGKSGRWLIGYGHSRTAQPGMIISEAEAEALLEDDVKDAEAAVKRLVTVPVNVNEFSAMASLCYNLGASNFGKSAVVREINLGNRQAAADAFRNHTRAGYQVIQHLVTRREEERALFLSPV